MTVPIVNGNTLTDLVSFAREFAADAISVGTSVNQLENAYRDVNHAIRSIPNTLDPDNVVRHALMENMLRRETHSLLTAILSLQKTLTGAIRLLTDSGEQALAKSKKIYTSNSEDGEQLRTTQFMLIRTLRTFELLELRLSKLRDA